MPHFKRLLKNQFLFLLSSLALIIVAALAFKFLPLLFWKPSPPAPTLVNAVRAETQIWPQSIQAIGTLEGIKAVDLSTEAEGRVTGIFFQSGEAVKAGQLVVKLNDAMEQAQLKIAQAQYKLAEIDLKQAVKLAQQKFISDFDVDQKKANLEKAAASIDTALAALAKKNIVAPIDGTLGIHQIKLGQYLQPGTFIVSLNNLSHMYLNLSRPEKEMPLLTLNQAIEAQIDAFPEKIFQGKITAIDLQIDQKTRQINLQATFENPNSLLYPGMFAKAEILIPTSSSYITLPETAVDYSLYGNTVYTIQADRSVKLQYVKTGPRKNNQIAILEGLKVGDSIVADGQIKLHQGVRVEINANPKRPSGALDKMTTQVY